MKAFLFLSLRKSTKKNGAAQKYPPAAVLFNRIYKEVCILFLKDLKVSKIALGTEEMPAREGENRGRMVSTLEITLTNE